jgi:transposase
MTIAKYSREFKEDALRIAEREGVVRACEKLGIKKSQIYDWRRSKRESQNIAAKGLKSGETIEEGFKRLEQEVYELQEANVILKKAMGFLVGR